MQTVTQLPPLPPRPVDGHKGTFGKILIVGGSADMIGAPVLAGAAALRMGSGLVQVAMPSSVLAAALSVVPELTGLGLSDRPSRESALAKAADDADALVVGPGLGQGSVVAERINLAIRLEKPMVIDAAALSYLATLKQWPKSFKADAVLTPHPGEMGRLNHLLGRTAVPSDDAGRAELAAAAASSFGQVLVLKGHRTVVSDGQRLYVNNTGDSSLAKAGAGDVLSGMVASLLGQKMTPFDAACAAVHLHGLAGEIAGKRLGARSVLARDVIESIPAAIQSLG